MSFAVTGAIAIGATVVKTGLDYVGAKKAGKAAKKQAAEEARIEGLKTEERIRDLEVQERVMYGETIAQFAGSGVQAIRPGMEGQGQTSGSPRAVIDEQVREFAAERSITEEVGASNIMQIKMEGKATANAYKYKGYSSIAGGIADIASLGAQGRANRAW